MEVVNNISKVADVNGLDGIETKPRDWRSDIELLQAPHDKRPYECLRYALQNRVSL